MEKMFGFRMKLLKTGKDVLSHYIQGRRYPLNVSISVTNRCNLRCSYCDVYNRDQKEMSTQKILDILDDLGDMGCYRVGFWGGEPTMRDDIGDLISRASENNLFTTMISNGIINPREVEDIEKLDKLFLSIDGPKELHEKNKGEGTFDKTIESIETARDMDIPVTTITVLTGNEPEKVDFVLEKAEQYDFNTTFQLIYRNSELTDGEDFSPEYKPVLKKLLGERKNGAPIASSKSYLKHLLQWENYSKTALYPSEEQTLKCYGAKLFCNIDTDGKVYPCDWMIGKMEGRDASELGFKEAWDKLNVPQKCGGCLKSCYSEYNLIFSRKIEAVRNAVKFVRG